MIVSENSLALVALILAASEIDAWSVVVNPRLSAREVDLIREHGGARRVFYTIEVSEAARQHAERHDADIAVLRALGTLGVGPLNRRDGARAGRGGSVAPGRGARVYLRHDRQRQRGNADPPQPAVQRADNGCATRPDGQSLLCFADIAHRRFLDILLASLMVGATVQLVPRFDPAEFVSAIANDGLTHIFGVPATYQRLLEYKTVAGIEKLPRGKLRRLARRRRAARCDAQIQDRGGIRAAAEQRLRHHRMCPRYRRRPGGDAEKRRRRRLADHRDRGASGQAAVAPSRQARSANCTFAVPMSCAAITGPRRRPQR